MTATAPMLETSQGNIELENMNGNTQKSKVIKSETNMQAPTLETTPSLVAQSTTVSYVPKVDPLFIKWGNYADVKKVISSKLFYPCFITGLSGNGKTHGIEQACADLGREFIRVNITEETDEDDLIGGYRLNDGNMVWQDGPVLEAMVRGAVLLLDEVDLASSKIMSLQSVLEGKRYVIKKTGRIVEPTTGFTIFATANTKGKGSDDGRFAGTNVLNEAFLDRFPIMLHQAYPNKSTETKILTAALNHYKNQIDGEDVSATDKNFINKIVEWCDIVRDTFEKEGIDEVISTRRAIEIMKAYVVFGSRDKAIKLGVERFDNETRQEFSRLYQMIDEKAKQEERARAQAEKAKEAMNKKSSGDDLGTEIGEQPKSSGSDEQTVTDAKARVASLLKSLNKG